ncbi:hybrid sensor histidine kinase/response regulator [Massilia brevitalea]|uniref:hybrid sensor histidine kinase/response regulator n=1 Tax=Massilia brevitalea TaxID=442526 RepID=UPI0027385184|nr:ATP-binding protein [Massilia brevitalea]
MFHEDDSSSLQRSLQSGSEQLTPDPLSTTLLRHIGALEDEVARLRESLREKEALEATVERLREANEHLVVAAINAQGSRDDAEATNRRQNEFLAMLAHELRNPLVPISMSAMLLERSSDASPQLLNFSKVIRRQVDHMARLLDDLLDAARISSGKITLSLEPMPISHAIDQALETVLPRIRERGQHLYLNMPQDPGEPAATRGDRVRLTQVFTNLIGNASKYTGDGGNVYVDVTVETGEVVVAVRDNGTGIAPEVLPHIFDLFTQGPRSLARSEGGLGVGLNVVRNLVSMHGGTVRAESGGLGHGSRFVVRLPLCALASSAPPLEVAATEPSGRCRVLLVEDNIDACETLKAFLELEAHDVTMAHDGKAGLEAMLAHDYDVVVCDIGLPGMDGLEVLSRLRASGKAAQPLAIGLSGYGQAEDRSRALAAGFDHYLVKPVSPDALLALVAPRR